MAAQPASPSVDVTLIVIAYNERDHAAQTVRAILDQDTEASFELVFVDDGSNDGTAERVTAAAAGDQRVRMIRLPQNRGRGAARQAGVEAARGRAIGFVDADITLPPYWLRRCLAELPGNAAVGGIAVPDGDAAVVARISGATPRAIAGSMAVTGSNVLFDRAVFEATGFDPRDRLGEDFRLANRLVRMGHRLRRVPGLEVRHEESRSYAGALRWRFENGIDAASHPRELGRIRFADIVWLGWLGTSVVGIGASAIAGPDWLLLPLAATAGVGLLHAWSRFRPAPLLSFVVACVLDVPVLAAYLLGRTVAIPRFIFGRR